MKITQMKFELNLYPISQILETDNQMQINSRANTIFFLWANRANTIDGP